MSKVVKTAGEIPVDGKVEPKTKATKQSAVTRFITLGTKGTFCFSATADADGDLTPVCDHNGRTFKPAGMVLYANQATGEPVKLEWKGKGDDSALGKALGAWVTRAGGEVRILPLAVALKTGLVKRYKLVADKAEVVAYMVESADYADEAIALRKRFPQYIGTDCAKGRIENFVHKSGGKRQAGTAVDEIELA